MYSSIMWKRENKWNPCDFFFLPIVQIFLWWDFVIKIYWWSNVNRTSRNTRGKKNRNYNITFNKGIVRSFLPCIHMQHCVLLASSLLLLYLKPLVKGRKVTRCPEIAFIPRCKCHSVTLLAILLFWFGSRG